MTKILRQIKNVVVTSLSKAIIVVSLFATLGMVYAQIEPVVVVKAQGPTNKVQEAVGAVNSQQEAVGTTKTNTTTTQNGDAGGFVPCGNEATNPCQIGHLFSAFVVIINYLIAMAGFIAVIAIVYAGFMMVYSQGQEQLKEAKGRISGAVIGLVLVAAAFIIINAIFAGSLSIGVKSGGSILSSPLDYIQNGGK